jgi:adenine-specific DNA-methyltransferase
MTINDINNILLLIAEQPSRDNIFKFSFALLEWMGIEPNTGSKPQLLSPQTQKLKDFLATAPQTVQPQLYRISADNQNIRVRFAVLKKLKKDYISQLVDNDPGLGSYQAFSKGLTKQNETAFIPTQPYFIHFVTTPTYNKLVLVINQGEQKRIVSFRNRLTNTQYNKIFQLWQGVGSKSKPEIASLLWKSLDIKEVNKEFYKQIKERFDALLGIVKTQQTKASENQLKQFTVRLIGRYLFCWFLKEKGIIPYSLISKSTIASTSNYYQNVLLKLFFETLNTKVQDRNPLTLNKQFEKIPYLNGGLFDESDEDKLFSKLQLDSWLLPFVEILENYDFTVDESSSQYQQVAVDPEMLGRIFENLLASQNEETEKLANQRKVFGAFYTPREIVDYMVNGSIKAFLQTQWEQHLIDERTKHINNPEPIGDIFGNKKPQQLSITIKSYELKHEEKEIIEKSLVPLFLSHPHTDGLKKEEKNLLLSFLEKIKILDPACGSGAFPMGILHKLVELNEVLGTVKSSYELKKDILSQNIYGVDIMPMAIEIARLRAWLSLVLEEDYKPNDPKHNFGVKPLPNLDFKFVCANSLIDLGLDAFIQDSKGTLHEGFTQKLVKDLKDLETLRTNFFNPTLASSQKEKLKVEYFEKRDKVVLDIEEAHDPVLKQIAQKIKHWNPFDDSHPSTFFSPTWMFGIDKGFDVVIGNPPYVEHKKLKNISSLLKDHYKTYSGTADLYVYFYENGIKRLRDNGTLVFITSNKFVKTSYGQNLRRYFAKYKINEIIDFTDVHVFEALVASCIFSITKQDYVEGKIKVAFANDSMVSFSNLSGFINQHQFMLPQNNLSDQIWQLETQTNLSVKEKIETGSIRMENTGTIKIFRGVTTGYNPAFIIGEETKGELVKADKSSKAIIKPLLQGRNIRKWIFNRTSDYLIFTRKGIDINEYPAIRKHLHGYMKELEPGVGRKAGTYNWFEIQDNTAYYPEFEKEKIIWGLTSDKWTFAYDNENNFLPSNGYILTSTEIPIKYLLALMNSRLMEYYFGFIGIMTAGGAFTLKQETVSKFPIKIIKNTKPFIDRVEKILSLRKKNDESTSLEKELDILVYHLYELTYEEVKIIDNDFWLSEEEYGKFKLEIA